MLILGSLLWRTTGQGAPPPPPPPVVTDQVRPSGGIPSRDLGDRGPTQEQIRRSRILHGLLPSDAEVVASVAARQAQANVSDTAKQAQELAEEMRARKIELRSEHMQALAEERQALIDAEIGARLRLIQDNQNALILLLLASA